MPEYKIRKDSPSHKASVDGVTVKYGLDPVELTEEQADRLREVGVILYEVSAVHENETKEQ